MKGSASARAAPVNVTSVNLASSGQKKVQTTNDIMRQIEASMPDGSDDKYKQEGISARILGRIDQHEAAYGDQHLPRSRLPRVDAVLLDRYQAARRNVLLLGALKAGPCNGSATTRSNKATPHPDTATSVKPIDADTPAACAGGLGSMCTSFSGATARTACDISPEASGAAIPDETLAAQCSQLSVGSGTRRMRHQCSSRSAASSCADSAANAGLISSRQIHRQNSSASAASGHTLRSEATEDSRSRVGRCHKKTPRKKKRRPGRVTLALAEYNHKDDWMSKTLLRHYLASIIQARWRGYQLRKRWAQLENREQIVEELKAKHAAEDIRQERLRELEQKVLSYQQKQIAKSAAAAAEAAGASARQEAADGDSCSAGGHTPGRVQPSSLRAGRQSEVHSRAGPHGVSSQAVSAGETGQKLKYLQSLKLGALRDRPQPVMESDDDSDWSDVDVGDIASIKFRAFTPPWQKAGEQWCGSKQLRKRAAAAAAAASGKNVGIYDDPSDGADIDGSGCSEQLSALWADEGNGSSARLQQLRHRRICRRPEPVALSEPAVAAAAVSGLLSGTLAETGGDGSSGFSAADPHDSSAFPVPHQVVEQLLLERYSKKYTRLGVPNMMPGRQRWLKQQRAAREAAAAAAAAASSADATRIYSTGAAVADTGVAESAQLHAVMQPMLLSMSLPYD